MFYDVLMEKRAEREEDEDTAPGSLAAAGGGALTGAVGFHAAEKSKGRLGDFIRKGGAEAESAIAGVRARAVGTIDLLSDMQHSARKNDLDAMYELRDIAMEKNLPQGARSRFDKMISAAEASRKPALSPAAEEEQYNALNNAYQKFKADMWEERKHVRQSAIDEMKSIDAPLLRRRRLLLGGGVLGGAAMGYGVKKLYDTYNQRKQERN